MILAGDIGGTRTRMAFFENAGGKLQLAVDREYPSREHKGLDEIVGLFVREVAGKVDAACFGVAGPVLNGRVSTPNLAWLVDVTGIAKLLNNKSVWLINDLEAHAYSLAGLAPDDFKQLNPNAKSAIPSSGNAALIAPGTGLGEAGLHWNGTRHVPFASEGGHADFAPRNDLEIELLRYLTAKFERVSYERILSGPGLVNVYNFLRDTRKEAEPDWLHEEIVQAPDVAGVIARNALAGKAAICERALDIFVIVLGAETGNAALRFMATGGMFIGGGIPPKILPKIVDSAFMEAFLAKGRMRRMLEPIPVNVVLNGKSGLIGAARCALLNSGSDRRMPQNSKTVTVH
ncbi:MAG: glucokinase [Acidobacteriales bacterium]|nr:glucokinase [Terriglobales bacterium]